MKIHKTEALSSLTWQWCLACGVAKLIEIWLDGVAGQLDALMASSGGVGLFLLTGVSRLVSGAVLGVAQWRVLRQLLPQVHGWLWVTSLGSAIAFAVTSMLWPLTLNPPSRNITDIFVPPTSTLPLFVFAALTGLIVGTCQWIVLRRKLPQSSGWIGVSVLGLMLAEASTPALQRLIAVTGMDPSIGSWNPIFWVIAVLSTLFYSTLTGAFFLWKYRQTL